MRPAIKRTLLIIVLVLGLLILAAAVFLYPYYRMPPESKSQLDAALATYQAAGREMAARPKADREALETLIQEVKPLLEKQKDWPKGEGCPPYDVKQLLEQESIIKQLQSYGTRFQAMMYSHFTLQQDADMDAEIMQFTFIRQFIYWLLGGAVLDFQQGRRMDTISRIAAMIKFDNVLFQTPTLIYNMMAVALNMKIYQAIVFIMPHLTEGEIDQLADMLKKMPDARAALIQAMEIETTGLIQMLDAYQTNPDAIDKAGKPISKDEKSMRTLFRLARSTGYLKRERYQYLSFVGREIKAMQAWVNAGGKEPYRSPVGREIIYCPLVANSWPNWATLMEKASDDLQRRQAVIAALQMVRERNRAGDKKTVELPYLASSGGSPGRLVINQDYGCILPAGQAEEVKPSAK